MKKDFDFNHANTKIGESLGVTPEREEAMDNLLQNLINPDGDCDQDCENCTRHVMTSSLEKIWEFAESQNELTYMLFLFGCFAGETRAKADRMDPLEALLKLVDSEVKTPRGIIIGRGPISHRKPKAQA